MTVIFVITKNKYFNVIEETAQAMCMDFINDNVWCIQRSTIGFFLTSQPG